MTNESTDPRGTIDKMVDDSGSHAHGGDRGVRAMARLRLRAAWRHALKLRDAVGYVLSVAWIEAAILFTLAAALIVFRCIAGG